MTTLDAAALRDRLRTTYRSGEAPGADIQVALLDLRDIRRNWRRRAHEQRHPAPAVLQPARSSRSPAATMWRR